MEDHWMVVVNPRSNGPMNQLDRYVMQNEGCVQVELIAHTNGRDALSEEVRDQLRMNEVLLGPHGSHNVIDIVKNPRYKPKSKLKIENMNDMERLRQEHATRQAAMLDNVINNMEVEGRSEQSGKKVSS